MIQKVIDACLRWQAAGRVRLAGFAARLLGTLRRSDPEVLRLLARLATENQDYAAAERYCERLVALRPDDPVPLRVLGDLCLRSGRHERALEYFSRHDTLADGPCTVTRAFEQRHLDLERAKQKVPYYVRLENVLVDTGYWSIMTDAGVAYSPDTHGRNLANSPLVQGRTWNGGRCVVASFWEPVTVIEEECIFVGGDENYSHWLFRNLLKLVSLDDAGLLQARPWLLNRDLRSWQAEYLDMLGVAPAQRILVDRGEVIRCAKLVVPALLTNTATLPVGIAWIRRRLARYLHPPESATGRIYVSRADASHRHILNEDELYAMLRRYGFTMITPGRLSVEAQIAAFSSAALVVCAHGAATTNIVFSPPGATIVELCSAALAGMDDFRRAADGLGVEMVTLVSDRLANGGRGGVNADYYVDVAEVERTVGRTSPRSRGARETSTDKPGCR